MQVQYFGQVYADRDVPWHYPWLYFAATVPVGLQALGAVGLVQAWRNRRADPFLLLLVGSIGFFLVVIQHQRSRSTMANGCSCWSFRSGRC